MLLWHQRNEPQVCNEQATIEKLLEIVFSLLSDQRLYNEDSWIKPSGVRQSPAGKNVNMEAEESTSLEP
jgi:hypothetical protein